jgi:hypothetical protein
MDLQEVLSPTLNELLRLPSLLWLTLIPISRYAIV